MRHVLLAVVLSGCVMSSGDDESTYEQAITLTSGELGCTNPKKVVVCHIPPGNPDNAHAICVGAAAVKAHVRNHGDSTGACTAPTDDGGDNDGGDGGDDDGGDEDDGGDDDHDTDGRDGADGMINSLLR